MSGTVILKTVNQSKTEGYFFFHKIGGSLSLTVESFLKNGRCFLFFIKISPRTSNFHGNVELLENSQAMHRKDADVKVPGNLQNIFSLSI